MCKTIIFDAIFLIAKLRKVRFSFTLSASPASIDRTANAERWTTRANWYWLIKRGVSTKMMADWNERDGIAARVCKVIHSNERNYHKIWVFIIIQSDLSHLPVTRTFHMVSHVCRAREPTFNLHLVEVKHRIDSKTFGSWMVNQTKATRGNEREKKWRFLC